MTLQPASGVCCAKELQEAHSGGCACDGRHSDKAANAVEELYPAAQLLANSNATQTMQLPCALLAGFIVDKSRGIICTNRHVVTPGAQSEVQCGKQLQACVSS